MKYMVERVMTFYKGASKTILFTVVQVWTIFREEKEAIQFLVGLEMILFMLFHRKILLIILTGPRNLQKIFFTVEKGMTT